MGTHRKKALAALLCLAAGAWAIGGCGTSIKDDGETNEPTPDAGITVNEEPDAGPCVLDEERTLQGLWGSSGTDVWTVGGQGGLVFHNTTRLPNEWVCFRAPVVLNLASVWGSGPNDIWFVGEADFDPTDGTHQTFLPNIAVHYDGSGFSKVDTGVKATFSTIWGSASNDIWAGGFGGALAHYDGSQWSVVPSGTDKHINAIWGTSATDVWAVGEKRLLLRWDGMIWRPVTTPISKDLSLLGVWGTSKDDVYVTGAAGTLLHWTGVQFEPISVPGANSVDLKSIWGAEGQMRMVGTGGAVFRFKNGLWGAGESPSPYGLTHVWGVSIHDYWIVGDFGKSRHYDF